MKEINEAYDQIMAERSGRGAGPGSYQAGGYQNGGYRSQQSGGRTGGIFGQVRAAINSGNLALAEEMLQRSSQRDAEWYFLMGTVYYRKGWYDEASRCYQQACNMDPGNAEYRSALNMLNMTGSYAGYRPMQQSGLCDCCVQLACLNCLCSCCGNGC